MATIQHAQTPQAFQVQPEPEYKAKMTSKSKSHEAQTPQTLLKELTTLLQSGDLNKDLNLRQNALQISSLLNASLQTPDELAFETNFLSAYNACCSAAHRLHLFEIIAESNGPITADEIASRTGSEKLLIARILRVITANGLVSEVAPEIYEALPVTHSMTSPMIRAAHQHLYDQGQASLLQFPAYLSQSRSCPKDAEHTLFQLAYRTPESAFSYWATQNQPAQQNFDFLMTCIRGPEPAWLSWFPIQEVILEGAKPGVAFVDVGGGRGHDVRSLKRKVGQTWPVEAKAVLQDLPVALEGAGEAVSEGIEVVPYDFFTPQTVKGAKVYYYAHILHDWADEACVKILRNTVSALEPGYSKILLYEFILPETGCSRVQAGYDIYMMGMHAGMERTSSQWTELLDKAGLKVSKFWRSPTPGMEGIIEAELKTGAENGTANGHANGVNGQMNGH